MYDVDYYNADGQLVNANAFPAPSHRGFGDFQDWKEKQEVTRFINCVFHSNEPLMLKFTERLIRTIREHMFRADRNTREGRREYWTLDQALRDAVARYNYWYDKVDYLGRIIA